MSTRKTIRRHVLGRSIKFNDTLNTERLYSGIASVEHAMAFCGVVTNFVVLESQLDHLLEALINNQSRSNMISTHILGSLRSATAKYELLKSVLENSVGTRNASTGIDAFLENFKQVNNDRNQLVHGKWYTDFDRKTVYVARLKEANGVFAMFSAAEIELDEIRGLASRIWELGKAAKQVADNEYRRRRRAQGHVDVQSGSD